MRAFLRVRGRVVYVWVVIVSVHLQERLQVVRNLRSYLRDDFVTMKHINSQPYLSSHPILAEDPSIYRWGRHSDDVIIEVGILCKFILSIHRSSRHTSSVTSVVSHLSITISSIYELRLTWDAHFVPWTVESRCERLHNLQTKRHRLCTHIPKHIA